MIHFRVRGSYFSFRDVNTKTETDLNSYIKLLYKTKARGYFFNEKPVTWQEIEELYEQAQSDLQILVLID